jgi:predicted permease
MRFMNRFRLRVRSLFRRSRIEDELSSELAFHLEQQISENIEHGMNAQEARNAALRTIGNLENLKDECRDTRRVEWIMAVLRDVHYAVRTLRNNPGFTAVAVLSLALGIGVNTALFSVVDAVMLKSLPVGEPERLVVIDRVNPSGNRDSFSYPLFEEIRDRVPVFSGVFAALHGTDRVEVILPGARSIVEADLRFVSTGYFEVLQVRPAIGHLLTLEDHQRAASAPVVVISHRFWKNRLNQDPAIVGETLTIGRQLFTVAGVGPMEFFGESAGQAPDIWTPVEAQPILSRGMSMLDKPNVNWLKAMARLAPGVAESEARAALNVFSGQLKTEPGRLGTWVSQVQGLELSSGIRGLDELRSAYSLPLRLLMTTVGLVLLIACANVANLLLARGAQRQREIAIRLALGAKRSRVVRQLMTENLCIALLGGGAGVLVAIWTTKALLVIASQRPEPLPLNATVDFRVLLFTAVVCILSSLAFGLVPAIHATRGHTSLTVTSTGRPRQFLGRALIAGQVAICIVLLSAAGLLVRTLHNLRSQNLGFRPDRLLQVRIDPQASGYKPDQLPEVYSRVLAAVRSAPGVLSASMSHSGFNTGISRTCCIAVEAETFSRGDDREVRTNSVLPDYFETVGLPLLLGRTFTPADIAEPPRIAVLSKSAARRYFGTASPVGKRIGWGDPPGVKYSIEIAGVVEDANIGNLREEMRPIIYLPASGGRVIHVRASMDPAALSPTIRQAIQKADANLPLRGIQTITEVLHRSLVVERLMATLTGFFGVLALFLAAVGLHGVIDYSVRRRTQEIGVRMALGARPANILKMISREVATLLAAGIILGVPATLLFTRLLAAMLFGIEPDDLPTIAIAAGVLAAGGLAAAIVPSRRAASVTPITALRYE